MSNYFVRRRDKSFGPFTIEQLLAARKAGKLRETDFLSSGPGGPWTNAMRRLAELTQPQSAGPISLPKAEPTVAPTIAQVKPIAPPPTLSSRVGTIGVLSAVTLGVFGLAVCIVLVCMFSSLEDTNKAGGALSATVSESGPSLPHSARSDQAYSNSPDGIERLSRTLQELSAVLQSNATDSTRARSSEMKSGEFEGSTVTLASLSPEEATDRAIEIIENPTEQHPASEGFQLIYAAAQAGNAKAMYNLFVCHMHGYGTSVDATNAYQWLKRSSEAGSADGMYTYSIALRSGELGQVNNPEGLMWLHRAAAVGHAPAIEELNGLNREAAAGLVGSLFSALSSTGESSDESVAICRGAAGCPCRGFRAGGLVSNPSPSICRNCLHDESEHFR